MKKQTKLAKSDEIDITYSIPFTEEEIKMRHIEYPVIPYDKFRKQYRNLLYTPIVMKLDGKIYNLQFNKCNNPFCKWYGLNQKKYDRIKSKPSRYKLGGGGESLRCNDVADDSIYGEPLDHQCETISNWSVAEEIKRLTTINAVVPIIVNYNFHKTGCINTTVTPFDNKNLFYKRGKSTSNSPKYQCKECKKITNILPAKEESFNYHQGRNDVLVQFTKDILARVPVKRTCEILDIASGTYYNKLELLYKRCLEFLKKHETKPLESLSFKEIWLDTDMLIYNLNNIKQKGKGSKSKSEEKEKKLQTYIIASGDLKSGYVFRSDIAYDFNVNPDDVVKDTELYHCDHSYSFLRKNERLKYPYYPQYPTAFDIQTEAEYIRELLEFNKRKDYVSGYHIKAQYTALAHYLLIGKMVNTSQWYFVSDDDSTLESCIFRVFSDYVRNKNAHYFTCQSDKSLTLQESGKQFFKNRQSLIKWGKDNGYTNCSIEEIAIHKIESDLYNHDFYEYKTINGIDYPVRSINPIMSPLADKDEGNRFIKCITDTRSMTEHDLAKLLVQVNSRTINNYFQELRRRVSILERPLVTSRGEGKSYIYSNYNPKYAQYIVTIFRTFYNFCWTKKQKGVLLTPAQRLGLTDKVFDVKDIVYFK